MDASEIVIHKSIKCKQCGRTLKNLALYGDYDEGFECITCGQMYDAWGEEC